MLASDLGALFTANHDKRRSQGGLADCARQQRAKQVDKLKDAKTGDFASVYDPMQVSAHKDAVSLFERYAEDGENAKLKDWVGKTLPSLEHHLEMAQGLNNNRKD